MPEVLGIHELGDEPPPRPGAPAPEVAGGEDDGSFDRRRLPSVWRRWGAILVVVVLALAVARTLTGGGAEPTSTAPPTTTAAPTTVVVSAPPAEAAARAALEDWARFATTGDLDAVRETFDPAGPQFAHLAGEELSPVAGPPYRFDATVGRTSAGSRAGEQLVSADVVVSRTGEAEQSFSWEIVMRQGADQSWRLWTVRDRAAISAGPGGTP